MKQKDERHPTPAGERNSDARDRKDDEKREHRHESDESWSTPRWGPLLDEEDTGAKKSTP